MNISKDNKKLISDEIKYVLKKMEESDVATDKLYFFSAIYGIVHRIFNFKYDLDLLFTHHVLKITYDIFLQKIKAVQSGETPVMIDDRHFNRLAVLVKELLDNITNDKSTIDTLKKFIELGYTLQGNGFYLLQKGIITID